MNREELIENYLARVEKRLRNKSTADLIPDMKDRRQQRIRDLKTDDDALFGYEEIEEMREEAIQQELDAESERLEENHPDLDELIEHLAICENNLSNY